MKHKQEFLKLQSKWYQKLKEAGFEDIETLKDNGEFGDLLLGRIKTTPARPEIVITAMYQFYVLARSFLHVHDFKTYRHRLAWEMFSEGHSMSEIGQRLGINKSNVQRMIAPIRDFHFMAFVKTELNKNDG